VLDCWLADAAGGGLTTATPTNVTIETGVILETIVTKKRYLVIAPTNGVVTLTVNYTGAGTWYWGVSRYARAYYSTALHFT
jgi:hypothetical protein